MSNEIAIVGGGVAGLTAAALLAKAGASVTVYEQHNVPGGCASFYQRDGFRFDVGATVVNGFGPRGIHTGVFEHLGVEMPAERIEPAMAVHLDGERILRYGDERWNRERRRVFGEACEPFWRRQERLADRAWDFAARRPCLPVDLPSVAHLSRALRPRHLPLVALQGRTLASILPRDASPQLRRFVDLQLLITAQAPASDTDLSFGVTALDIAREGTFHLPGGIADIAIALARSIRKHGGRIAYNTGVRAFRRSGDRIVALELNDGSTVAAKTVIAAVPFENVQQLLGETHARDDRRRQRWSAVTAYAGIPEGAIDDDHVLHHQVLLDASQPLGEGNSAFISISSPHDRARARKGGRAVTISTHTDPKRWYDAVERGDVDALKREYAARLSHALERAIGPVRPVVFEVGTPLTFERYTGRYHGLVGGVPQAVSTANLRARSHRTRWKNLLLCGDTVFPGQSTVGVTLSAINATRALGVDVR